MIPKSIKWRLQIWYGLILVLVLAGFGVASYQLERGRLLRRVDEELMRRMRIVSDAMHPRHGRPGPPPFALHPDQMPPEADPDELPGDHGFQLSPWEEHFFGTNDEHGFYCLVQARDGREIARRGAVPLHSWSERSHNINRAPDLGGERPVPVWTPDNYREVWNDGPSVDADLVVIGCSLAPELKELDRAALNLAAAGGLILLVGLAGGGWFVSRALRPIEAISATAVKISAGDLSQRINVAEAESELGQLAGVLNSTFARLETAFAQQQQFTADAAHELRTPVSVMLTQTQTALNRERSGVEYRETLEACQRASQRMRKLIESLLELARLDAGQETLKRLKFDLASTANDCVNLVQPLADEHGVKILREVAPLDIAGDSERLAQVVTNLLVNAIQYNHPDGEVRLKLESRGGLAVLTVADTGSGISAGDLPHVFERFYRGDKSRTVSTGNAGLGLAICKAIVEAHGGMIEVSSQMEVGTTFTIRLPTV